MRKIAYLSYYAEPGNPENRVVALSATSKMDYICDALNNIGYTVEIVSGSVSWDEKRAHRGKCKEIRDGVTLRSFSTLPWKGRINKAISLFWVNWGIARTLLKMKKDEKVLVYHSLAYMPVINILHKIKRFDLILEVEEVYSDVIGDLKQKEKELRFLMSADGYIFPTKLLNNLINQTSQKPYAIIHGTYRVEQDKKYRLFNDSLYAESNKMIHCVYAGTLDPRKGGAIAAVAAAEFLPHGYHIHIIGFGSEKEIENIRKTVSQIACRTKCKVSYDGLYYGEEYTKFLQSCDIGLSTQNPAADFNATSYPSKILSYMANGLRVVSIRIPAVESSSISNKMFYYDEQTPEKIAAAIMAVDFGSEYDSRALIAKLASDFEEKLANLLNN